LVGKFEGLILHAVWTTQFGYQFAGGSRSRHQFWHISVINMVRLSNTVSRRQHAPAVVTCVLHRRDSWSFPERELWRPKLCHPRTSYLEQSTCWTASSRHCKDCIQKQTDILDILRGKILGCGPASGWGGVCRAHSWFGPDKSSCRITVYAALRSDKYNFFQKFGFGVPLPLGQRASFSLNSSTSPGR